jgi:ABC-type antimicrobial peptide transport system permease subunit
MKKEFEMNDKKATTGGLGIGTILFLIFLTLKLAEVGPVADWSWWWVTSPLWIPLALVGVIVAIVVGIAVIAHKLKK